MLKEKQHNSACLFLQISMDEKFPYSRYNILATDAIESFKRFNPNCDVFHITNENFDVYKELFETKEAMDLYDNIGILKFVLCYHIMKYYGYTKILSLGVDTITCAPLDEFFNDSTAILATLNYPCQESTEYWTTPFVKYITDGVEYYDHGNINADIICFNSIDAIRDIIELTATHFTQFAEQGAVNEMAWVTKKHPVKIVDFPYPHSTVVYNARSKGVFGTDMIKNGRLSKSGRNDGELSPIWYWYVKNNRLYTRDHKEIKVFHYVEGLGGRPLSEFTNVIDDFKTWFNPSTIEYFKIYCGCKLFS
jgi:hypothetical protein